jgi:hypothetical protein
MFEQIFGSKTRVKLMKVFLENPEKRFFVRELTRELDTLINSIRRELANLIEIGLVVEIVLDGSADGAEQKIGSGDNSAKAQFNNKKYYALNKHNLFRRELENLFAKEKVMVERNFTDKIIKLGGVKYLALSGFFVNDKKAQTDLIAVGDFNKEKVQGIIKQFEKDTKRAVNYTLMDGREYLLRKDIADRFLNDIIGNEQNLVVLDNLKEI